MLRNARSILTAALTTALLGFTAAPAQAQTGLVTVGAGTFQAFTQPATIEFAFLVLERHDGSSHGFAVFSGFRGPGSSVVLRVTSHMRIGATSLFAGEVVSTIGDPNAQVGQTAFTAVNDNGHHGRADEIASLSLVPLPYGNPTIQQIVGLIGPPTPASFTPVLTGNIFNR